MTYDLTGLQIKNVEIENLDKKEPAFFLFFFMTKNVSIWKGEDIWLSAEKKDVFWNSVTVSKKVWINSAIARTWIERLELVLHYSCSYVSNSKNLDDWYDKYRDHDRQGSATKHSVRPCIWKHSLCWAEYHAEVNKRLSSI